MKKYILLIVSFLIFTSVGFTQIQSGEVIYKIKEDSEKLKKSFEDSSVSGLDNTHAKVWFANVNKALPYISYTLKFTTKEASFSSSSNYMSNDSGVNLDNALSSTLSQGEFYTNMSEKISLRHLYSYDKDWIIKDELNLLEWDITNETKQIQGYTCYKAVAELETPILTRNEVIAWFTPAIPFRFGPLDYGGLPGLILEVEHGFYTFYADKIDFSKKDKKIKRPNKGELLNRQEYLEKTKELSNRFRGGR